MLYEGFHWPDTDKNAHAIIIREARTAIPAFLSLVIGRSCVIQAGANVGVYPKALTEHFAQVVSAEPDPENFACLLRNAIGRAEAWEAAFGETDGTCAIRHFQPDNCGAHQVDPRGGDIRMMTIDGLRLEPDAIWLDIEGLVLPALKGARETIERCHPVIVVEEKGLGPSCADFLADLGYTRTDRIGNDNVYKHG